jgi:hypothetical protein
MNINEITQLVGTLGFPIVSCGALFWQMVKSDKQHLEEAQKWTTAINELSKTLAVLTTKIGDEK